MRVQPTAPPPPLSEAAGPSLESLSQLRAATLPAKAPVVNAHRASAIEYVDEVVMLSPFVRHVLWCVVLVLIVSNALVLAVFAHVYARNSEYDSLLWVLRNYFLFSDSIRFLHRHSMGIAVGYGLLSAVFCGIAVRMVVKALADKKVFVGTRLVAFAKSTRRVSGASRFSVSRSVTITIKRPKARLPERVKRFISRARRAVGVRGPYFELRVLIEEWVELGTQTAAAYSASYSISNAPLNFTYALVIFVNSVSTMVFWRVFPSSLIKQRLACVMTDLVLDFLWGTLLPIWMYVPIVVRYMHRSTILDDPTSISGFTRAVQRILILEWESYAVSLIPFLSSLIKLVDLQYILRDLRPRPRRTMDGRLETRAQVHVGHRRQGLLPRIAHALMPLYGIGVLCTSLAAHEMFHATPKQADIACGYRVHPWFASQEACLQRKLNCSALGLSGGAGQFTNRILLFDRLSLSEIFFIDCPALEMPSEIHGFEWLMSIVIVNSTVRSWDESAALTDAYFSDLRNVQLYGVDLESEPVGFTGSGATPVATSLEWIHLEDMHHARRLLDGVGNHWHRLQAFGCINCGLTEFPELIQEMRVLEILSLRKNDIASIPDEWLTRRSLRLQMLWLNGNARLTELPDSLWRQAATCGVFSVVRTNVSHIPEWLADVAFPGFQVAATHTPLCDGVEALPPRIQPLVSCG